MPQMPLPPPAPAPPQAFGRMSFIVPVFLVAVLGIVNALTVSIQDRRRELGVLRAVGALHWQVRRTIWMEAVAIRCARSCPPSWSAQSHDIEPAIRSLS